MPMQFDDSTKIQNSQVLFEVLTMKISVRTNYQNGPQQLKQQQSVICNAHQINIHEKERNRKAK